MCIVTDANFPHILYVYTHFQLEKSKHHYKDSLVVISSSIFRIFKRNLEHMRHFVKILQSSVGFAKPNNINGSDFTCKRRPALPSTYLVLKHTLAMDL